MPTNFWQGKKTKIITLKTAAVTTTTRKKMKTTTIKTAPVTTTTKRQEQKKTQLCNKELKEMLKLHSLSLLLL